MNYKSILDYFSEREMLSKVEITKIEAYEKDKLFSIHWELRSILYLGITFLSTGLGILVYKNLDTIGHNVLIALLAVVCIACFFYAYLHRQAFTIAESESSSKLDDFALLGACLAFLSLEGYLQYQYTVFGTRYGLAAFIPAILFFFCAYRFDHRGVLSMAITALASGVGVSIAPVKLWENNDFNSQSLLITAIVLGVFLLVIGWLSERNNFKKHFSFTYFLLGGNLAFIASLAGLFQFEWKPVYLLLVAILSVLNIIYAREKQSYVFMLMGVIYGYIALSYGIFNILPEDFAYSLVYYYFMLSGAGVIYFLIKIKELVGLKK